MSYAMASSPASNSRRSISSSGIARPIPRLA
jgi:hypothetical protein